MNLWFEKNTHKAYFVALSPLILSMFRPCSLTLEYMGDHRVVDFCQTANFQAFVEDTPFIRCLSYVTIHLLTIGLSKDLIFGFYTIEKIEIWVPKMQTKF